MSTGVQTESTLRVGAASGRVTWKQVAPGLYVASRAGEFLGSVDVTADGSFVALDGRATAVGRFTDLKAAQKAVVSVEKANTKPRKDAFAGMHSIAAAMGVLSLGLFVYAGTIPGL